MKYIYSFIFLSAIVFYLQINLFAKEPNFDDRLELEKIISMSTTGEWSELTNKSLPFDEFRQKKGLQYLPDDKYPYTGYYVQLDKKKRIRNLRHFNDGILDGPVVNWWESGLKQLVGQYRLGKKDGLWTTWTAKNVKSTEQNFFNGKLDGSSTRWYKSGKKSSEQVFEKGKILTAIGWKPSGERCPSTRVVDGVGVLVIYDDYGQETNREQFEVDDENRTVEYYENGNVREEGIYVNGQKNGLWIYYRPNGFEHFRVNYKNGERGKTQFSSSQP